VSDNNAIIIELGGIDALRGLDGDELRDLLACVTDVMVGLRADPGTAYLVRAEQGSFRAFVRIVVDEFRAAPIKTTAASTVVGAALKYLAGSLIAAGWAVAQPFGRDAMDAVADAVAEARSDLNAIDVPIRVFGEALFAIDPDGPIRIYIPDFAELKIIKSVERREDPNRIVASPFEGPVFFGFPSKTWKTRRPIFERILLYSGHLPRGISSNNQKVDVGILTYNVRNGTDDFKGILINETDAGFLLRSMGADDRGLFKGQRLLLLEEDVLPALRRGGFTIVVEGPILPSAQA